MRVFILLLIATFLNGWNLYPTYPRYLKKRASILDEFFFQADTSSKVVALTFDDGPTPRTKRLMRVLKKYQTPATFFLVGENLRKRYDRLYQNPLFSVGMHSYNHKNFDRVSYKRIKWDFKKTIKLFKKHNLSTKLFRPPFGVVNKKLLKAIKESNLKPILWSNDTNDWSKRYKSYKRVVKNLSSGDIILLHDHSTSPRALERLIKDINRSGFKIVPLTQLLEFNSTTFKSQTFR